MEGGAPATPEWEAEYHWVPEATTRSGRRGSSALQTGKFYWQLL